MANTHTKLLAGAFSVLAVAQFFMVSDLSKQVTLYTENATASIMAAVTPVRVRLSELPYDDRTNARIMQMQKMHSAAPTRTVKPTGLRAVKGPDGRQVNVLIKRAMHQNTDTTENSVK